MPEATIPLPPAEAVAQEQPAPKATGNPILDDLAANWGEVVAAMKDMMNYYGYAGEVPPHVVEAFLNGRDLNPSDLRTKVLKKLHIHMLVLWSKGEIPGPNTRENLMARAKRAETAASSLKKLGQKKSADNQAVKAEELRALADQVTDTTVKRWW